VNKEKYKQSDSSRPITAKTNFPTLLWMQIRKKKCEWSPSTSLPKSTTRGIIKAAEI
jgi:hypothetical protein